MGHARENNLPLVPLQAGATPYVVAASGGGFQPIGTVRAEAVGSFWTKGKSLLFLKKKKQKDFLFLCAALDAEGGRKGMKVFWFFFSKKNRLPLLAFSCLRPSPWRGEGLGRQI
jgi:hypothetical protein